MITTTLPDPYKRSSGKVQNTIIRAATRSAYFYPKHTTPYLLLANFQNTGEYLLNDRPIAVNSHLFYFLNEGDQLEITFRKKEPLETVIIMFSRELISTARTLQQLHPKQLLDNNVADLANSITLPSLPIEYNFRLTEWLTQLSRIKELAPERWEEIYFELAGHALDGAFTTMVVADRLPNIKMATRHELYRRIMTGKTYLLDNWNTKISMDQLAHEACMNKFHFLRIFKRLYGITPHQYLTRIRLKKADELLQSGEHAIGDICREVGFESVGSFTNLFKRYFHYPPSRKRLPL